MVRHKFITCKIWPKKQYDPDTDKYILDKCEKLFSQSVGDIFHIKNTYNTDWHHFRRKAEEKKLDLDLYPSLKYEWEF